MRPATPAPTLHAQAKHISQQSMVADLQGASPQVLQQVAAAAAEAHQHWQALLNTMHGDEEEEEGLVRLQRAARAA